MPDGEGPLAGFTIGITADRRWSEQAQLFEKRGAAVLHGATLRTINLSDHEELRHATLDMVARPPDYLVVTTGMGMRMWLEAAATWGEAEALKSSLAQARILVRGPKSSSAVRNAGLEPWWQAPHETMDDVVGHLTAQPGIARSRVAVQLFDPESHPSTEAVRAAAGELVELPVYQWNLPVDEAPALRLIEATLGGELQAVTFTAQPAVRNLFRIAERAGFSDQLRAAMNGPVLTACVGPVCAAAARGQGLERPIWPEPARLPAMVRQVTEHLSTRA